MHSGGHARKRIDFYILLCGIWCFPPLQSLFFSCFTDRFFIFYFPFFFLQTQVEFFAADCIQKGHGQSVGRLGRAWHRQPVLLWLRRRLHARCRTSHCRNASSNFMMPPVCSRRKFGGGWRTLNDTCGSGNMPRFVARPSCLHFATFVAFVEFTAVSSLNV